MAIEKMLEKLLATSDDRQLQRRLIENAGLFSSEVPEDPISNELIEFIASNTQLCNASPPLSTVRIRKGLFENILIWIEDITIKPLETLAVALIYLERVLLVRHEPNTNGVSRSESENKHVMYANKRSNQATERRWSTPKILTVCVLLAIKYDGSKEERITRACLYQGKVPGTGIYLKQMKSLEEEILDLLQFGLTFSHFEYHHKLRFVMHNLTTLAHPF